MKIDTSEVPLLDHERGVRVGNVYAARGGKGTAAWVVISVRDRMCSVLGFDHTGSITSAENYGVHAFAFKGVIGRVDGLDELNLKLRAVDTSCCAYGRDREP